MAIAGNVCLSEPGFLGLRILRMRVDYILKSIREAASCLAVTRGIL